MWGIKIIYNSNEFNDSKIRYAWKKHSVNLKCFINVHQGWVMTILGLIFSITHCYSDLEQVT